MDDESYETLDESIVTELVDPAIAGSERISVARAMVRPGQTTLMHVHRTCEEVYYVLRGEGVLRRGAHQVRIGPGEAHLIQPNQEHNVTCVGNIGLQILCICSPPYSHEDTEITEGMMA